jgi:peptidoglycan hydrolase-like protein with peptidoglycan-binding domain
MDRKVLVTGSAERVSDLAAALENVGFDVVTAADEESVATASQSIPAGSVDCYIQLPRQTEVSGPSLVARVRQFLAEGLLTRFETASRVLPLLSPDACVVLVAGNVPGTATPDDRHARIDLLRVLARAILAERPGTDVRAVVVGYDRSAEEIAGIALHRGEEGWRVSAEVRALDPELDYADWYREVLSLTADEE